MRKAVELAEKEIANLMNRPEGVGVIVRHPLERKHHVRSEGVSGEGVI